MNNALNIPADTVLIFSTITNHGKLHAPTCAQVERARRSMFRYRVIEQEYRDETIADLLERGDTVAKCKCVQ